MLGIHGTCRSLSDKIQKDGFNPSVAGRAGPGVYFWRYYNNENYATYLSYQWWKTTEKRGDYNRPDIKDTKCSLIIC